MLRRNRVQVAAPPKPSNRCASHAISNKPTLSWWPVSASSTSVRCCSPSVRRKTAPF
jgi:hypothetical protein